MEMGSIFVLYIKPTIPTYVCWVASDYSAVMCGLLAGYKEQKLIPFPSFIPTLVSLLFQAMVIPTLFFFHFTEMFFHYMFLVFFSLYGFMYVQMQEFIFLCMQGQKFLEMYSSLIA